MNERIGEFLLLFPQAQYRNMQEGKNKGTVWITHTALEFPETAD